MTKIIFAPYKYNHINGLPDLDNIMREIDLISEFYRNQNVEYQMQIQLCINHTIVLFILKHQHHE